MQTPAIDKDKLLAIIELQTEVIEEGLDLGHVMDLMSHKAQLLTESEGACIELIEKDELVYSAASGIADAFLGLRLPIENSLSGLCIKGGLVLMSDDTESDPLVNQAACRRIGLRSMIVAPLVCKEEVVGVLKVFSKEPGHFSDSHQEMVTLISHFFAAVMWNAMQMAEGELLYRATHDHLTGLANRALFYDRLRQRMGRALEAGDNFGILFLDLDDLKLINDHHGHRVGDAVIKEVGQRVQRNIKEVDLAARIGGDEFAVIVDQAEEDADLTQLAQRLDKKVSDGYSFEGILLSPSASIGVAFFQKGVDEMSDLIDRADRAMYENKRKKKKERKKEEL